MALLTSSFLTDVVLLWLGVISILYVLVRINYGYWRKKGVPFIKPEPFLGSFRDVLLSRKNIGECISGLYFEAKNKPFVGFYAFYRPILLVRDLDLIKAILVKDFNNFRDRNFSPNEEKDPLQAKNLFGMNGIRWRHLRNKLSPTFTSGRMKMMFQLVDECGKELVKHFEDAIEREGPVLEVKEVAARFTTDVIASVGFGVQSNALKDPQAEFRRILRKVFDMDMAKSVKFALAFVAPRLLHLFNLRIWDPEITRFSRRVVWQTVEHRDRTGQRRNDFLQLLMQLRGDGTLDDADAPPAKAPAAAHDQYALEGDDFVAQAFVFMAAGFETSSSTLTFALYELARHPDVQERLRRDVRAALRRHGGSFTYDALADMPFLHQVVTETLRLYPILPFLDRVAEREYVLPGTNVRLSKGEAIFIPSMAIQRDPAHFDHPNDFRPERWTEENKKNIPAYSFLAFGEGPRICIGMRMGLMQAQVGLAHIINSFEVRPSKHTPFPLVFDPQSVVLSSKSGMQLTVTKAPLDQDVAA